MIQSPRIAKGNFIVKYVSDNSKLSTREIILDAIKQSNEATVDNLAIAADVSPVTVRHHLNSLQAEGLLEIRSVRRKVGRPYYVYSLSDQGNELFPQRYMRLSSRLLDELKANFPAGTVDVLFNNVVQQIVDEHRKDFINLSVEERLDYLVGLLGEEGFLASWESSDGKYTLTEYSCPYFSVGQKHDEVCTLDRRLVQIVLDTDIKQESCMLHGDSRCQFTFSAPLGVS
jgi:DeoR family suf operon transcriptional repressor